MMASLTLNTTYDRIATFNKINEGQLAKSLVRVASGKKYQRPSDNIPDFLRSQKITNESRGYQKVLEDVGTLSAMVDVAKMGGEHVFGDLSRMQELTNIYYHEETLDEQKPELQTEFNVLVQQVMSTIANTLYDGKQLIQDTAGTPLKSINLDPKDISNQFAIEFDSTMIADVSGLTLGGGDETTEKNALQAELSKAASYLGKVNGYSTGLEAQYRLVTAKVNSNVREDELISGVDMGEEVARAAYKDIRHQASLAMMAQANMVRSMMVKLLEF